MRVCPRCQREFLEVQDVCPLDDVELGAPVTGKLPPNVGRVLGAYRVIGLLGEGGMGNIYIAAHTRLNRYVAIKVLRPELQDKKQAISRFFDEARTVNRAKHPNIVESIDLVEDVVDGAYCVLELLRGADVKTRLAGGRLPLATAVHVAAQIADALNAVHELGIVHRDLKPENVMMIARDGRDDFVKLIDFGVAEIVRDREEQAGTERAPNRAYGRARSSVTDAATGAPFGTAAYMAPEQAAGERVDGRADLYSLGVLLFEMVTGRHPLPSASDQHYVMRHADDPPPRPSRVAPDVGISPKLDAVILRCLAKQPADRYATAADLAHALRTVPLQARKRAIGWVAAAIVIAGAGTAAALVVPDLLRDRDVVASPEPAVAKPAAPELPATQDPAPTATLSFESTPPGARVFRGGETVPLGTTPFKATLPRSTQPSQLRFELAGHEPLKLDVLIAEDQVVTGTLVAVADQPPVREPVAVDRRHKPPQSPPPPKKKPIHREGVMDPFQRN